MWFGSEPSGDPHSLLLDFVDVVFVGIVAAFFKAELPVLFLFLGGG